MFTLNQVSLFFSFASAACWCVRQHFCSKCPWLTAGPATHSTNSLGFPVAPGLTQLQVSPLGVKVMFLLSCLVLLSGTRHQNCVWSSISMLGTKQRHCPRWEGDSVGDIPQADCSEPPSLPSTALEGQQGPAPVGWVPRTGGEETEAVGRHQWGWN